MVQTSTSSETENLLINLPKNIKLLVTQEHFQVLAIANRDLRLERKATGVLIVNPPNGWETGNRNSKTIQQLANWADTNDTGLVFDSSTGFTLPNGAIRSPDASWVSK